MTHKLIKSLIFSSERNKKLTRIFLFLLHQPFPGISSLFPSHASQKLNLDHWGQLYFDKGWELTPFKIKAMSIWDMFSTWPKEREARLYIERNCIKVKKAFAKWKCFIPSFQNSLKIVERRLQMGWERIKETLVGAHWSQLGTEWIRKCSDQGSRRSSSQV